MVVIMVWKEIGGDGVQSHVMVNAVMFEDYSGLIP